MPKEEIMMASVSSFMGMVAIGNYQHISNRGQLFEASIIVIVTFLWLLIKYQKVIISLILTLVELVRLKNKKQLRLK
jgi:hypothetical protein